MCIWVLSLIALYTPTWHFLLQFLPAVRRVGSESEKVVAGASWVCEPKYISATVYSCFSAFCHIWRVELSLCCSNTCLTIFVGSQFDSRCIAFVFFQIEERLTAQSRLLWQHLKRQKKNPAAVLEQRAMLKILHHITDFERWESSTSYVRRGAISLWQFSPQDPSFQLSLACLVLFLCQDVHSWKAYNKQCIFSIVEFSVKW